MTLTQLRTFLAVADAGSVHGAADQLYVTHSAVSASLAALQRSLGIQLIQRDGREIRLTEAGALYADYIKRVLGLLEEAGTAAAAEASPKRSLLRVAAVTVAGEQILPSLLTSFRRRHPQVGIQLEIGNRERVHALLHRREVDLVLGERPPVRQEATVLGSRPHELIVVASGGAYSRFDEAAPIDWAERQTWLLREKGSGTREAMERFLSTLNLPNTPQTLTMGSNATIRESVIAGLGVTLISRDAVLRELVNGTLVEVPLSGTPLRRDWHLLSNLATPPPAATAMVAHVLMTGEFERPKERTAVDLTLPQKPRIPRSTSGSQAIEAAQ